MIEYQRLRPVFQYDWLDARFHNVDWMLRERLWWRV